MPPPERLAEVTHRRIFGQGSGAVFLVSKIRNLPPRDTRRYPQKNARSRMATSDNFRTGVRWTLVYLLGCMVENGIGRCRYGNASHEGLLSTQSGHCRAAAVGPTGSVLQPGYWLSSLDAYQSPTIQLPDNGVGFRSEGLGAITCGGLTSYRFEHVLARRTAAR